MTRNLVRVLWYFNINVTLDSLKKNVRKLIHSHLYISTRWGLQRLERLDDWRSRREASFCWPISLVYWHLFENVKWAIITTASFHNRNFGFFFLMYYVLPYNVLVKGQVFQCFDVKIVPPDESLNNLQLAVPA